MELMVREKQRGAVRSGFLKALQDMCSLSLAASLLMGYVGIPSVLAINPSLSIFYSCELVSDTCFQIS